MGKFMRKCKGIGEIAVMEVSHHVGVITRARMRTLAMAEAKRKRVSSNDDLHFNCSSRRRRRLLIPPEISISPTNSESISRCSSNDSSELLLNRSVIDLKDSHDIENLPYRERRENTASSELHSESNNLESIAKPEEEKNLHKSASVKMPTESELEDFFTAAESAEKKRFSEKYNYDFEKDAPLQGRYEWIPMKI